MIAADEKQPVYRADQPLDEHPRFRRARGLLPVEARESPDPVVREVAHVSVEEPTGWGDDAHVPSQKVYIGPVVVYVWIAHQRDTNRPLAGHTDRHEFARFDGLPLASELLAASGEEFISGWEFARKFRGDEHLRRRLELGATQAGLKGFPIQPERERRLGHRAMLLKGGEGFSLLRVVERLTSSHAVRGCA